MDKVVHFEIPADDIERAKKFYSEIFGWKINAIPEMNYTIVNTGSTDNEGMVQEKGYINGGMLKRNEAVKNPVITINVDDIKSTISKIENAGGKLIKEPMKVGDMGLAAYFKDSEGNVMGLWQSLKKD